jgi:glycosyltransferase involved in cell wall biosynthesis
VTAPRASMKIIHVSPMYAPALGGAEHHLKTISEGLVSRGHDVTVLTANVGSHEDLWPGRCGHLPAKEVMNGVKVIRFLPQGGWPASALKTWLRLRGGYRSLRFIFGEDGLELLARKPFLAQLFPYLLRARADIVASMNWYWPPAYHAYLARKLKQFTLVGIPLFHTADSWCGRDVYRRMLAACDAVVVNTSYEADFVRERAAAPVAVTGVGVDPKSFGNRSGSQMRARYGLGDRPVVGFVGRQAANKGAAKLVQAMSVVWKWNPEVRLVLAGPRANRDKEMEAVLGGLTQFERERIVRVDDFPAADKASIFDSFDVFVLPSTAESFGIAYLEAWLCRKPVIGAGIGPTRCVIDDGVDGLLVDPDDSQDIARATIELLSDANRRRRMGNSGYAKTVSEFTWDKVVDKLEKLYVDLSLDKRRCGQTFAKA